MQSEPTSPALRPSVFHFETSEQTDKLDEAWAKAQGEIDVAIADAENPHFKSSYADLASCWRACRTPLSKYGIALTQWPVPASAPNKVALMTRIAHGGQWMRSTLECPVMKQDAQGVGSALTYLRRYMLSAVAGIAPDDDDLKDDDGNKAAGLSGRKTDSRGAMAAALGTLKQVNSQIPRGLPTPIKKGPALPKFGSLQGGQETHPGKVLSDAQLKRLFAISTEHGWSNETLKEYMSSEFGVFSSKELSREQYDRLIQRIELDPVPFTDSSADNLDNSEFNTWPGPGGPTP